MSSKNRNFRRKVETDQPADEPDSLGMPPARILAARKAKEKEKKGKKAPLLSFEEEEPETLVRAKPKTKDYGKAKPKPSLVGLSIAEDHKLASTQRSEAGQSSFRSIAKDFKHGRPQVPVPVLWTTLGPRRSCQQAHRSQVCRGVLS